MPQTRICTWSERYSVEIDPGYATQIREGGTMALRDDIPGMDRSLLHVLGDEEWEGQKHTLVHEEWRVRVRTELSAR